VNTLQRHEHFKKLVKSERTATHEVLLMIQSFDITKEFRALGYSSLFDYLTLGHGYSAGAAHRRISSARLMKEVPQIEESLITGELSLTQVSLVQVAISQEQKVQASKKFEVINKIKSKNSFETKKILKQEFPNFEIPKPQVQPGANNKVHVTLEFTEENWDKIQKLMAKMSRKVPSQKLEDLLIYWANALEKKESKITSAVEVKKAISKNPVNKRIYLSVGNRRQLARQSQNQCEYVSKLTGRRCGSMHFLETDHRIPLAKKGTNEIKNLRKLCRAHNRQSAKEWGLSSPM
jgi:hypothetical protein